MHAAKHCIVSFGRWCVCNGSVLLHCSPLFRLSVRLSVPWTNVLVADKATDLHPLIRRRTTRCPDNEPLFAILCHPLSPRTVRSRPFPVCPVRSGPVLPHKSTFNRCRRSACQEQLTNSLTTTKAAASPAAVIGTDGRAGRYDRRTVG